MTVDSGVAKRRTAPDANTDTSEEDRKQRINKGFKTMGTHRKPRESKLNRTLAIGAIAGATAGFGALATLSAPVASADEAGWWLTDGDIMSDNDIASGNNTVLGSVGSGISNQSSLGSNNIVNNQFNVLSPVIGSGTAVNSGAATATGGSAAAVNAPIAAANGTALGTTLGVNPALAGNLGGALGGLGVGGSNLTGANAAAAVPVTAGAAAANQIPLVPVTDGTTGDAINAAVGAANGPTSAGVTNNPTNESPGTAQATNAQVAGASSGNVSGGGQEGGNTSLGTNIVKAGTGGSASASNNNSAIAGGNVATNTSNTNTSTNNGNNSPNTVGNNNDSD